MKLVVPNDKAKWLWGLALPPVALSGLWGFRSGSILLPLFFAAVDWLIVSVWVQAAGMGYFHGRNGQVVSLKKSPFSFWLLISMMVAWYVLNIAAFTFGLVSLPKR